MIAILISVGVVVLISQHRRNLIFFKKGIEEPNISVHT